MFLQRGRTLGQTGFQNTKSGAGEQFPRPDCKAKARVKVGTGLMGTQLNGYLVLQGNIPFRTAQSKHVVELLARKRRSTRWAKYPFRRCRKGSVFSQSPVRLFSTCHFSCSSARRGRPGQRAGGGQQAGPCAWVGQDAARAVFCWDLQCHVRELLQFRVFGFSVFGQSFQNCYSYL